MIIIAAAQEQKTKNNLASILAKKVSFDFLCGITRRPDATRSSVRRGHNEPTGCGSNVGQAEMLCEKVFRLGLLAV